MFHGSIPQRIALTKILLAPGGEKLSRDTARWCAELMMGPVSKKLDAQAASYKDVTPHIVLNQLGEFATSTRRERDRMQREMMNLKLRNSVVVAVVTAVLVKAPEIVRWATWLFR